MSDASLTPAPASPEKFKVPVDQLSFTCDPSCFDFETTADLSSLTGIIGQERAVRAMNFGLKIRRRGYNIYMSGVPGSGKTSYAISAATAVASKLPVANDWVYVHNFRDPDQPIAISFKPGGAREFQSDMDAFIEEISQEIPKALESDELVQQRQAQIQRFQEQTEQLFGELERFAVSEGFQLRRTPAGFITIPIKANGQPMNQEEFTSLPEAQRNYIEERSRVVQVRVAETLNRVRLAERETRERIRQIERELILGILSIPIGRLKEKYKEVEKVQAFLDDVQDDILKNLHQFSVDGGQADDAPVMLRPMGRPAAPADPYVRYRVNVMVDNSEATGAPVVFESHPVYYNLIGQQEYAGSISTVNTDHTMIKAGALHRANGGFLILHARDVLANGPAWDGLKRALLNEAIYIEAIGEQYRLIPIRTIRPEPIPLNVKVILIGTPGLFHLLHMVDEDFRKLFKIKADFDIEMPRNEETMYQYAMFVCSLCRRENLRHFDRTGVARLLEHAVRLAGDRQKVTTRFNEIVEVIYEADAWAQEDGADVVSAQHVDRAIREKIFRSDRIEEKIREMVTRGHILVQTTGSVIGQVNGLSVLQMDDYAFGRPSRITARTFLGEKGIVNIEREIEMSGRIHDKGVLTLAGYLGGKYAQDQPLSLTASITFEQLYEGIDGDSASSAELYALLSSLADLPLRQDLAVTGSVDQFGRIQPVGGVNEKIEGFFRVCREKGLTGTQGVIIPAQNVENLVLDDEVVEAVRQGLFHIYAIQDIDEGLELLTGVPAGQPDENLNYPPESVHGRVKAKLATFAALAAERFDGGGRPREEQ